MDFSALIKQAREKHHASAREFHRVAKLPCSYYYYSTLENGTLPNIDLALVILKALKINLRKGLYAWVRSQMPDKETKAYFTELDDQPPMSSEQMSQSRALIVNRMQSKLLQSNPVYWELLLHFSVHYGHISPLPKDLSKSFKMTETKILPLLNELYDYGLLDKDKKGTLKSKEWVYIPYEKDYEGLRDVNFRRALDQFMKQPVSARFRTTITRLLTKEQQMDVETKVVALTNAVVDMKDEAPPEAEPYTIGVFASTRRFGDA